jgi:hypothetical protein
MPDDELKTRVGELIGRRVDFTVECQLRAPGQNVVDGAGWRHNQCPAWRSPVVGSGGSYERAFRER